MDKNIKMTILFDIYGKLLTNKQQEIFKEYYLYNLSLREIAQNRNISYQGVRDSIKSSENMLENFEENIGMLKIMNNIESACEILNNSHNIKKDKEKILKLLKSEDDI